MKYKVHAEIQFADFTFTENGIYEDSLKVLQSIQKLTWDAIDYALIKYPFEDIVKTEVTVTVIQ